MPTISSGTVSLSVMNRRRAAGILVLSSIPSSAQNPGDRRQFFDSGFVQEYRDGADFADWLKFWAGWKENKGAGENSYNIEVFWGFLYYLKGIETEKKLWQDRIKDAFLYYLKGIETQWVAGSDWQQSQFLYYLKGIEAIPAIQPVQRWCPMSYNELKLVAHPRYMPHYLILPHLQTCAPFLNPITFPQNLKQAFPLKKS
ncbi:hypothetical protein [Weizmannia acidilactici]|uniref:hypothetical protein n=1 Tax=Weizmannia acidilactici TaxID=2607726 RepID=UPI003FCDC1CF